MLRPLLILPLTCAGLLLAACTTELNPRVASSPVGDFRLDRVVVIVEEPTVGALSRRVDNDTLKSTVSQALEERFARFDGETTFAIGAKAQGYVLAQPGIPVVFSPRSMLFLSVNVYYVDPEGQAFRLNDEPNNLTVFEDAGGDTFVGSGYTQSAEEQLEELASNAAIEIEKWMRSNAEWFTAPKTADETQTVDTGA